MSARVFITYSHDDKQWVRRFADALKKLDVDVWFDEWEIEPGDSLPATMEKGLRESDAMVAVLSPEYFRRPYVFFELGAALGMRKRLIPIVPPETESERIPFDLRSRRYLIRGKPSETAEQVAHSLRAGERKKKAE
jgi:hypothetical protein